MLAAFVQLTASTKVFHDLGYVCPCGEEIKP
jgi:hypothetical protein